MLQPRFIFAYRNHELLNQRSDCLAEDFEVDLSKHGLISTALSGELEVTFNDLEAIDRHLAIMALSQEDSQLKQALNFLLDSHEQGVHADLDFVQVPLELFANVLKLGIRPNLHLRLHDFGDVKVLNGVAKELVLEFLHEEGGRCLLV